MEAIKIVALHLEGEAQDWWFHGLTTLGNHHITSYSAFTNNLVERFDPRDSEGHIMGKRVFVLIDSGATHNFIDGIQPHYEQEGIHVY